MSTGVIRIDKRRKSKETGQTYYEIVTSMVYLRSDEIKLIIKYYAGIYNIDNYNIILTAIPDIGFIRKPHLRRGKNTKIKSLTRYCH